MAMYSSCSEQYWNNKKKPEKKRRDRTTVLWISCLCFFAFVALMVFVTARSRSTKVTENHKVDAILPAAVQPPRMLVATEAQFKRCADHFKQVQNSAQNECLMICSDERTSVPRPTMYQACIHGCNSAYFRSAGISCNGGTPEKVVEEVEAHSYQQCSRFEGLRPRIELVSSCRKYHDIGSKKGFSAAKKILEELLLDSERVEYSKQSNTLL